MTGNSSEASAVSSRANRPVTDTEMSKQGLKRTHTPLCGYFTLLSRYFRGRSPKLPVHKRHLIALRPSSSQVENFLVLTSGARHNFWH